jgi:hypothetical protein
MNVSWTRCGGIAVGVEFCRSTLRGLSAVLTLSQSAADVRYQATLQHCGKGSSFSIRERQAMLTPEDTLTVARRTWSKCSGLAHFITISANGFGLD